MATWAANFRDLRAAVTRMGTLARGGVIRTEDVAAEERRLLVETGIAEQEGAAQMFIGRTGDKALAKLMFGSVAAGMAQIAPVPCTIVP